MTKSIVRIVLFLISFSSFSWALELPTTQDPIERDRQWKEIAKEVDTITLFDKEELPPFNGLTKDLINPEISFIALIQSIRNERHTIDFETYILKPGVTTNLIFKELRDARARGVAIRGLVDSIGSFHLFHSELKALLDTPAGVMLDENDRPTGKPAPIELKIFNSISNAPSRIKYDIEHFAGFTRGKNNYLSSLRFLIYRTHNKGFFFSIHNKKRARYISGGRNLTDDYYGIPQITSHTYNDSQTMYRNDDLDDSSDSKKVDLSFTVGRSFELLFYRKGNKSLKPNIFLADDIRHKKNMDSALEKAFPPGSPIEALFKKMETESFLDSDWHRVRLQYVHEMENFTRPPPLLFKEVFDPMIPNPNSIILQAAKAMSQAKRSITIISPYLTLQIKGRKNKLDKNRKVIIQQVQNELELLLTWLENDPSRQLKIIVNSILTTDNPLAQGMVDDVLIETLVNSPRADVLKDQIIFGQLGKLDDARLGGENHYGKLHAKLVIIDDQTVISITSNGDIISRRFNMEGGFIISPPETLPPGQVAPSAQPYVDYYDQLHTMSYEVMSEEWKKLYEHKKLRVKKWMSQTIYGCAKILLPLSKLMN